MWVRYGFDAQLFARLVDATQDRPDDALVLRVDGLHCFFREEIVRSLLDTARANTLDIAKCPDDFPPALTGEVWRVGSLRHLARTLATWPAERAAPHYVHPKFLAMRPETGLRVATVEPPPIADEVLNTIRQSLARAFQEDHIEVTRSSIAAGDQISFHYVLASRYLQPTDNVLDVASAKDSAVTSWRRWHGPWSAQISTTRSSRRVAVLSNGPTSPLHAKTSWR